MNENRYSMDNIHFMRKMADIKKAQQIALNSIKKKKKTKKLAFSCTFSTRNWAKQSPTT